MGLLVVVEKPPPNLYLLIFYKRGAVHATPGNWNNQIGVPITLLGLDPLSDRFSVVEAGINQTGEMASLARMIEGDLTIITTIGAAHLEQLFNLETVAEEKSRNWLVLRVWIHRCLCRRLYSITRRFLICHPEFGRIYRNGL